jgi:PelA/Pel-15E family pectate lyase
MYRNTLALLAWSMLAATVVAAEPAVTQEDATGALRRSVDYFRSQVSIEGAYLWRYAADFTEREGEVPASPTTAWVQPPGTPTVGMAYLTVHEWVGDAYYLEAAQEAAHALVRGQLQSGGWDYRITFDAPARAKYAYRSDGADPDAGDSLRNVTTLDDDTTQAALRFLMQTDRALDFNDEVIHEAAAYALRALLEAQYPNGAWPQRFAAPPDPAKYPVLPANYPDTSPREYPQSSYSDYYTFNDNTMADMIGLMFLAAEIYDDATYADAGRCGGDFMLLAQMPDPQPGWAQQYDAAMHPAWARKFEPAAITGGEAQGVMNTLLRVFELTGDRKYLEPLPRALAYYRASQLENGQLARFYELKTNRPLYFTKEYVMTYSDADMPTHYGFKSANRLDAIEAKYARLSSIPNSQWRPTRILQTPKPPKSSTDLTKKAAAIIQAQDKQGAWVELAPSRARSNIMAGTPSISTRTFVANIVTLAKFIAAEAAR